MYHFIYPTKDSYIYELNDNSEKNFGGDNNLILKKDFDGDTLNGVSRILLYFDLNELSQSIVAGTIKTDSKYFLRLYEQKTSELSISYELVSLPLSQSWEQGTGYTNQNPNDRNGVSWTRGDEKFRDTNWLGGTSYSSTGSRTAGGGVYHLDKGACSQSFSNQSPNINMDITTIVNNWLGGTDKIPNNGLIIKWSGSMESSISESGDMSFISSNANSIYSPKIEVKWTDTAFNTGSLTQLKTDASGKQQLYLMNLKSVYRETETPKFRVGGRTKYPVKQVTTTFNNRGNLYIPQTSGSYSIIDVESGLDIVPFGDYSLLSCDSTSNYFKQNLNGFINNRLYKILLKFKNDKGHVEIFDNDYYFKVVK